MVLSDKRFSVKLLKSYIDQLGIKYVVFVENGRFAGLIESKLFINQFPEYEQILGYDQLVREVVGINKASKPENSTVLEILQLMNEQNLSGLGIVDQSGSLKYIVERESLIAKLIASMITEGARPE